MVKWQRYSKRKSTGGKRHLARGKRKRELGRYPVETQLGDHSIKEKRVRGGNRKLQVSRAEMINVSDGDTTQSVKILEVIENPSNKDMDRRKIITKGTILDTKLGKVRVTSRPGQCAVVNGVLIEE